MPKFLAKNKARQQLLINGGGLTTATLDKRKYAVSTFQSYIAESNQGEETLESLLDKPEVLEGLLCDF